MTIDEFYDAYRTKVPPQYLSCLDALVELVNTDPCCYERTLHKIADKTNHTRQHVGKFFKIMRELRKNAP